MDYLKHVSRTLIAALREADELVRSGEVGQPLVDVVRHAVESLDIISEALKAQDASPELHAAVAEYRAKLNALRAALPQTTLH